MNLADQLDYFLGVHRAHGSLTPTVGEQTANGYRLTIACPCGARFERWVTPQDALEDRLRARLRAELYEVYVVCESCGSLHRWAFGSGWRTVRRIG
jgi:hypothetical protein